MSAELMQLAIDVAERSHAGQLYDGKPFIEHVRAVLKCVRETSRDHLDAVVSILHDVVEDSDVTIADIRQQFGDDIADAVESITKRKGEPYGDYIRRCARNPRAMRVKLCDLACNINNLLHADRNHPKRKNLAKYNKARSYLTSYMDRERVIA